MWRRYVLWFAHEHVDFRHAEMQSILSMFNIKIRFIEEPCSTKPYWVVELPGEESALMIASRSIMLKNCTELWARAKTKDQLHMNLKEGFNNNSPKWIIPYHLKDLDSDEYQVCPNSLIKNSCHANKSFKIEVETFCKHFTMPEKIVKIEDFHYLPLEGTVRLKNPDITLMYMEFYGNDPNNIPEHPHDLFFGRWLADGQRQRIQKLSLKTRKFIGNTSMDPQLSLLMANQAKVLPGNVVLDPFVGSGSLLVSAAEFGAYVLGSDIDFMMLHARTRPTRVKQKVRAKDENIKANMKQYGIADKYLDVLVSDFALPLWREDMKFDAIITDPPYGVREPTERIGIERDNYKLSEEHLSDHIPSKVEYTLQHIYQDLLNFSARQLKKGGRLVCWYPLMREDYQEDQLPAHPSLQIVANSEQILSKLTSRRLLTYEKTGEDHDNVNIMTDVKVASFREKYFALSEMTRRERKERVAQELARNRHYIKKDNR